VSIWKGETRQGFKIGVGTPSWGHQAIRIRKAIARPQELFSYGFTGTFGRIFAAA
jgi:hypothetical protein